MPTSGRTRHLGPTFRPPARRVVSLVPSLTEALFVLGAGDLLVGRTDFCVRPVVGVDGVATVGGTKNPDVAAILALAPDLVLANREENTRARIEQLAATLPVLLTDPHTPTDVPTLWLELGAATGRSDRAASCAAEVEAALTAVAGASESAPAAATPGGDPADAARDLVTGTRPMHGEAARRPRFVAWIWRDPWMAAGPDTYLSALLAASGWDNAVPRADARYPRLEPAAAAHLGADVNLFLSEPYDFALPRDLDAFAPATPAGPDGWQLASGALAWKVDGERLAWYPAQTAAGLRYAAALRARAGDRT